VAANRDVTFSECVGVLAGWHDSTFYLRVSGKFFDRVCKRTYEVVTILQVGDAVDVDVNVDIVKVTLACDDQHPTSIPN